MKPWLLAFVLLVTACKKSSSPPAVTNTDDTVTEPTGECASDADCIASCAQPDNCCDQLCEPCEQVFTRAELEAIEQWRSQSCAATSCPVARCPAPAEATTARCEAGTCVLDRHPV